MSALIAAAVLTGCGGGGDSQVEPACTPKVVRVQLFGDSTMYGYDSFTRQRAIPSPDQDLQVEMDARFGAGAVVVTNRAVSGTTSQQLLDGTDGLNKPWPQSVDADVIVINHAINDWSAGLTTEEYAAHLRRLLATKVTTILQTEVSVPQNYAPALAFAATMRGVAHAASAPIADAEAYIAGLPNASSYYADTAHPNAELYRLIAANVLAPVVAKQVAPMRCKAA